MLTFMVPPGIGDFSAMYSKFCCMDREIGITPTYDQPQRLSPFLDILPKVRNLGYGLHSTTITLNQTLPPGTDLSSLPDGQYPLSINGWLEKGGSVKDWVPGEMDYHYDINSTEEQLDKACADLSPFNGCPLIGVYTSAYGIARYWKFWGVPEWQRFLDLVEKAVPPESVFIFIGAAYDMYISEILFSIMKGRGSNVADFIGHHHIGVTTELIRRLDYFFVFPSGLGFIADVVGTPHVMWFPGHLAPVMGTFCDPELYESGQTKHRLFTTPENAFEDFVQSGMTFFENRPRCAKALSAKALRKPVVTDVIRFL